MFKSLLHLGQLWPCPLLLALLFTTPAAAHACNINMHEDGQHATIMQGVC